MIIDGLRHSQGLPSGPTYGDLVYRGLEIGAYCDRGWIHTGLVKLANEHGIEGKAFRQSTVPRMLAEIQKDRPCIASVTIRLQGRLRRADGQLWRPGGHLSVVVGYEKEDNDVTAVIVNHPSSWSEYNWECRPIELERFEASFSGAFMSFWIPGDQTCSP